MNTSRRIKRYKKNILFLVLVILVELIIIFMLCSRHVDEKPVESESVPTPHVFTVIETPAKDETIHPVETKYVELSEEDKYEFATLVYLEAGDESYESMKAVASVVLNRMTMHNQTFDEVVYAPNQFSPAYLIPYYEPSSVALSVVEDVLKNGPSIPEYVTFFRADYYFDWGDRYANYTSIDNTYFSYDVNLKNIWEATHAF